MEILVVGLNHKTAPLDVREKLAIPQDKAADFLKDLEKNQIFDERLLLSTCNRIELYGVGSGNGNAAKRAIEFLAAYGKIEPNHIKENLYVLKQPDSVQHLFSVASGLDSMVLGETEITGQVKTAYLEAHKSKHTGKVLNNLFQRSLKVAKNVRTQTDIGTGRVSVASVAVELAGKIFEDLKGTQVLLIGTGEMAAQVAKALVSKGAVSTIVSSRHHERAVDLAQATGGQAAHFDDYEERIKETDILIASTSAPLALIHEKQVRGWMRARHEKPLFLIDIAVPRNIEASVEKLDNVYLYNIDDLRSIAEKNKAFRESQMDQGFHHIHHQTEHFMGWLLKEFGPEKACHS